MSDAPAPSFVGGCTCGRVRFRLAREPLIVHCCHCRWCQRETGSAFAINATIEAEHVHQQGETPEFVVTASESGRGQWIARCRDCRVALWSHYAGSGPAMAFVRVGTLDDPDCLPPDVHIFTRSRQAWVRLPPGTPAFDIFYEREALWSASSLARREAMLPQIEAWQAACAAAPDGPAPWPRG